MLEMWMRSALQFRIYVAVVVLAVGAYSVSNLLAELGRPAPFPIPNLVAANAAPMAEIASAAWVSSIAPIRSDLTAQYGIALTNQALATEGSKELDNNNLAQRVVKSALEMGPHNASMWLALASLQARKQLGDPRISDSLKMSYFTGPDRTELIPSRLVIATLNDALADEDLKDLARGDVRAILLHYPDLRQSLAIDYFRGSTIGKKFLEETTEAFDPEFLSSLKGLK
jgi:hypothetical protein